MHLGKTSPPLRGAYFCVKLLHSRFSSCECSLPSHQSIVSAPCWAPGGGRKQLDAITSVEKPPDWNHWGSTEGPQPLLFVQHFNHCCGLSGTSPSLGIPPDVVAQP